MWAAHAQTRQYPRLPGLRIVQAVRGLALCCVFLAAVSPAFAMGTKTEYFAAGVRTFGNIIGKHESLQVAVWYPSVRAWRETYSTAVGGWRVRADRNARPAKGKFPVILISHDAGRERFSSNDLASALAENGYVVIAPSHTGDSVSNAMAIYTAASLFHRPAQLAAAYSTVLQDPVIGPMLDTGRLGLLGVGSGALTVLQCLGADIDASAAPRLCGEAAGMGRQCSSWEQERWNVFPKDAAAIRAANGTNAFIQPMPSVRAVAFVTPGWMSLGYSVGIGAMVPAAAVLAELDAAYPVPEDDEPRQALFPAGLFSSLDIAVVRGADHNVMMADCPADVTDDLPEMESTVAPEKRAAMRQKRNLFLLSFFRAELGGPVLPEPETSPETSGQEVPTGDEGEVQPQQGGVPAPS